MSIRKTSIEHDNSTRPLSPDFASAVAAEFIRWLPRETLQKICVSLGLTEDRIARSSQEYGRILEESLAGSGGYAILDRVWTEFNKNRPLKKERSFWQGIHDRIVKLSSKHSVVLREFSAGPPAIPIALQALLASLNSRAEVLKKLESATRSFHQINADRWMVGGIHLRQAIECVHIELVSELQTRTPFTGKQDVQMRAYLREIDFISEVEQKLGDSIYGLLSAEFVHEHRKQGRRPVRKDTALFAQSVVHSYLMLLVGRLKEEQGRKPSGQLADSQ